MLSPTTIMAETDRLGSLLEILTNPEKYKKQMDELRLLSTDADEKIGKLTEERVELQSLREEMHQLIADVDADVKELRTTMDRASKVVGDAIAYKADVDSTAVTVVREARQLVLEMQETAQKSVDELKSQADKEADRLIDIERRAEAAEMRLTEAERKLEELRSSL
jgi:chromosome segregation ATPase